MSGVGAIRRLSAEESRHVGSSRYAATVESIVEQLCLNAIDAGASAVAVSCDLGQFLIAVRDDGSGIAPSELPRVGELACTSKVNDEGGVCSHGYRGESLFAIGLVSTLEVVSRSAREAIPHMTVLRNGSRVMTCAATGGRARGTTVTVRDLFFNRPVQRKMLLRPGAIASTCERVRQMMARIALAHCNVSFSLRDASRGQLLLEARPSGDELSRLQQLFRSTPARTAFRAVSAESTEASVRVSGFVCAADVGHRSAELQLVFVNRRALARRDPLVKLAVTMISRAARDEAAPSPVRRSPGRRAPGAAAKSRAELEVSHAAFLLLLELPRQAVALLQDEDGVFAHVADERAVHACVSRAIAGALRAVGNAEGAAALDSGGSAALGATDRANTALVRYPLTARALSPPAATNARDHLATPPTLSAPRARKGLSGEAEAEAEAERELRMHTTPPHARGRMQARRAGLGEEPAVGSKRALGVLAASAQPPSLAQRHRSGAVRSCAAERSACQPLLAWLSPACSQREGQQGAQQLQWQQPTSAMPARPVRHIGLLSRPTATPFASRLAEDAWDGVLRGGRALGGARSADEADDVGSEEEEDGWWQGGASYGPLLAPSRSYGPIALVDATRPPAGTPRGSSARVRPVGFASGRGCDRRCEVGLLAPPTGCTESESGGSSDDTPLPRATPERPARQRARTPSSPQPLRSAEQPPHTLARQRPPARAIASLPMLGYLAGEAAPPDDAPCAPSQPLVAPVPPEHDIAQPLRPRAAAAVGVGGDSGWRQPLASDPQQQQQCAWQDPRGCDEHLREAAQSFQLAASTVGPRAAAAASPAAGFLPPCGVAPFPCLPPAAAAAVAAPEEGSAAQAAHPIDRWEQWTQRVADRCTERNGASAGGAQTRRSRRAAVPARPQAPVPPHTALAADAREEGVRRAEADEASRARSAEQPAGGLFDSLDVHLQLVEVAGDGADNAGGSSADLRTTLVPMRRLHAPHPSSACGARGAADATGASAPPPVAAASPVGPERRSGALGVSRALVPMRAGAGASSMSVSKAMLRGAAVVGQVDRKWIAVTLGSALALIDQHAADERVQLERLLALHLTAEGMPAQLGSAELAPAEPLALSAHEAALLREHMRAVQTWGWHVRGDVSAAASAGGGVGGDGHALLLVRAPAVCSHVLRVPALTEYLAQLDELRGSPSPPRAVLRAIISKACRSAIMFGTELTHAECARVVQELAATKFPFQCAHGRPTIVPVLELPPLT